MIPQRTIATPGLRTPGHPGWRALAGHALAAPAENPPLWLLGTLSFVLRGGVLFLLAPIVVLPTQVEVRLMLGGSLGSTGLSGGFWVGVAVATMVGTGLVLLVLYTLARIETAAFERLLSDLELAPEAEVDRGGRLRSLFVVESLTLTALLLAAVPLAGAVGQVTLDEILSPSSAADIYQRVLGRLGIELAILAAAIPVVDTISTLVVRQVLLGRQIGSSVRAALGTVVRSPLQLLASVVVAWGSLVLTVGAVDWALSVGWQATRASFLATTSIGDLMGDVAPLLVALMLSGIFVAGLALAGYVAAFRNALWTVTSLRR